MNEKTTILRDTFSPLYEKIKKMPIELAKYNILRGTMSTIGSKEYIYENDEKIVSAICELRAKCGKTRYYTKICNSAGISYNKKTKKISVWGKETIKQRFDLFKMLINYLNIDWFNLIQTYEKYKNLPIRTMMTLTLASHIISGKIKNPEEFIKDYLLISYKRKDIPWKVIRDYYNNFNQKNRFSYITLYNIFSYATNPISALNRLTYSECNETYLVLLNDVLEQCYVLNKKINFSWSVKRLNDEHEKMTNTIMDLELNIKETTPIEYNGELPLLNGMSIVNTEYEAYKEATYMHNCIYSNYWRRIKNKSYFVVKYVKDGFHYDIGIFLPSTNQESFRRWYGSANEDLTKPIIDQIKAIRNTEPSQEIKDEIIEWFNSQDVYNFFLNQKEEELVTSNSESGMFYGNLPF